MTDGIDPALSVFDVMDLLNISKSYAYQVMDEAGAERFAKKCKRVRSSSLEKWRREHEEECVLNSTKGVSSGGSEDLTAVPRSDRQRAKPTSRKQLASETDGKGSSLIPRISVRTKPRLPTPPKGG